MRDYRELKVWSKSHQLTLDIYKVTRQFPKDEAYGLTSQIRRACQSIPTNIAESCGRSSLREMANFLNIASGSASEVSYQILLAYELGYLAEQDYRKLSEAALETV